MHLIASHISRVIAQHLLKLTLYDMIRKSEDFKDVKSVLNDRTDWLIEMFRSCFTIHLASGSYFFMLSTLVFLIMAEGIHIHYGRLSPAELKERAETMGYVTFAFLFAMLDIGFVFVRIAGLAALSATPGLAASLVFVGILPSVILPSLGYAVKLVHRGRRGRGAQEAGVEPGEV